METAPQSTASPSSSFAASTAAPATVPLAATSATSRRPAGKEFLPSARTVLIGQVICVLLLLLPIVGYNVWSEGQSSRRIQLVQLQRLVQGLASRQITLAASTESLLFSMSVAPVVQEGKSEDVFRYLTSIDRNQPDFDGFAVFNTKGETVAGLYDGRPRLLPAEQVRSRAYFSQALRGNGFHISQALTLENGRTILPMLMPIVNKQGAVAGLVMATLSVARHRELMESMLSGDKTSVFLFDSSFENIFAFRAGEDGIRSGAVLRDMALNEFLPRTAPIFHEGKPFSGGLFRLEDPETGRYFVGSCTALRVGEDAPYMYIVSVTAEMSWGRFVLERYSRQLGATALVVLLMLYVARRLGTRYFARGLEQLSVVAGRTRAGDLSVRCGAVPGCREIVDLGSTVDHMMETLEQKTAELRHLAVVDPLTGLWNRRHFTEVAHQELALAARQGYGITVVMTDIDHFKRVNDSYGHAAGDLVLQQFATALRVNVRVSDLLARYGGEEFILLLPATDVLGAQVLVEKLRHITEALRVPLQDGREIRFTASFGMATHIPERGASETMLLAELQARADAALYVSKNNGRNRVSIG